MAATLQKHKPFLEATAKDFLVAAPIDAFFFGSDHQRSERSRRSKSDEEDNDNMDSEGLESDSARLCFDPNQEYSEENASFGGNLELEMSMALAGQTDEPPKYPSSDSPSDSLLPHRKGAPSG